MIFASARAACRDENPELFFPISVSPEHERPTPDERRALAICHRCPVRAACLAAALRDPKSHEYGVMGGMTASQRRVQSESHEHISSHLCLGCPPATSGRGVSNRGSSRMTHSEYQVCPHCGENTAMEGLNGRLRCIPCGYGLRPPGELLSPAESREAAKFLSGWS
jgi:WhiB family transcriptional regulator, redox-sensing transcriptional regulator